MSDVGLFKSAVELLWPKSLAKCVALQRAALNQETQSHVGAELRLLFTFIFYEQHVSFFNNVHFLKS